MSTTPIEPELRTLVVHGDTTARRQLGAVLAARGHAVTAAERCDAGLAQHQLAPFAIVLLADDLAPAAGMPELYQAFKRQAPAVAPLLLAVSAAADPDRARAALEGGADELLTFPDLPALLDLRLSVAEKRAQRRAARRLEHERLRQLEKAVETMQIGVTITDLDRRIHYVNPAEARMHGWEPDEVLGRDARLFAPAGSGRELPALAVASLSRWKRESLNVRRDGSTFPVQITSDLVRDAAGRPVAIVSCCEDIAERKAAEAALRESEERYALAARGARDGLWDWDLRSDHVYYSDRWGEILGYPGGELPPRPDSWLERIHPADCELLQEELARHLRGESAHFESSHRLRHRDGDFRWVLVRGLAVRDAAGHPYRMAGSLSDASGGGAHDPLTRLPNRAFFMGRLATAVERWQRHRRERFAVLLVDLDRFQVINDSLGPVAGDQLLLELAARLERSLASVGEAPEGTLARAGGDEFLLLLEGIRDVADAIRLAERVGAALHPPFALAEREVFTSASIGIAVCSAAGERAEELVRDAEVAMHRAKALGGARFQVFDKQMHERALARLRIESELRQALAEGALCVHYQPIVELATGALRRVEALVRWRNDEEGLLLPDFFIPVAEESDLVLEIDRWVLAQVCDRLRALRNELGVALPASVNLSGRHFSRLDVVALVRDSLLASGLPAADLELELTEGILLQTPEVAQRVLGELKSLGVRLCLDDFGTGYSSLSYLHQFPIDVLKVDRSFVAGMLEGNGKGRIVETIVRLARQLGLDVVAEGVETAGQRDRLQALGCDLAQGFFFARPMPWEQVRELLSGEGRPALSC